MKKVIYLVIVTLTLNSILIAQIKTAEKLPEQKYPLNDAQIQGVNLAGTEIKDITVYEMPQYGGKTGYFRMVNGKLVAPFKLTNVSFKIAAGRIVYIKKCTEEFPYETAYTANQGKIDLNGICGIRSDELGGIAIAFNGLSTVIHNNDCKRFFGSINIKVIEHSPSGDAMSNMTCSAGTYFRGANAYTFRPFNNANANTSPGYSRYVYDANPRVPTITTIVRGSGGIGDALANFQIGKAALREGRVSIVITTDLGSAHKTCDLCDDFSSNVRMPAPVTESVLINRTTGPRFVNAANNRIIMGPYKANGSRDGSAITASGGTNLDFRAHFTVTGL